MLIDVLRRIADENTKNTDAFVTKTILRPYLSASGGVISENMAQPAKKAIPSIAIFLSSTQIRSS